MHKIDKGVPIPSITRVGGRRGKSKYPWPKMEVGDSVFFEGSGTTENNGLSRAVFCSLRSWQAGNKDGKKFVTRTLTEGGVRGLRIWRVE